MSQFDPVIGADKSGLAYRQDDNNGKKAIMTHHKGATAPAYAEAGISWLDDSASPWALKLYDGTDWITIGEIDASANTFNPHTVGSALQDASETVKGLVERATDAEATAGSDTTRYITPKQMKDNMPESGIGVDQAWTDVTVSRAAGVTYTNLTGKAINILVCIRAGSSDHGNYTLSVDGITLQNIFYGPNTNYSQNISLIVPDGAVYSVSVSQGTINKWLELR